MTSPSAALTYRDYAALPDDGRRYELHEGALSVTPAPGTRHQRIVGRLLELLTAHDRERGLGEIVVSPVDVIFSDRTVVQPDLVYIDPGRAGLVTERAIEGSPTLAIEVISPSTVTIDRVVKPRLYARYAVPYLWLVDAEARVLEAFVLERGEYSLAMRATGTTPAGVPPFAHVALVPASLWPWSPISRPEPAPSRCAPARNNP